MDIEDIVQAQEEAELEEEEEEEDEDEDEESGDEEEGDDQPPDILEGGVAQDGEIDKAKPKRVAAQADLVRVLARRMFLLFKTFAYHVDHMSTSADEFFIILNTGIYDNLLPTT